VVGKFVEFFGPGLAPAAGRPRDDRQHGPEYGATCGIFPIDAETIKFLTFTGRDPERVALVEAYAKAQGMWAEPGSPEPVFTDVLELDLSTVEPALAGPKRPQDKVLLSALAKEFTSDLTSAFKVPAGDESKAVPVKGADYSLKQGDVVIAAITSCTNTSNPSVLVAAGLLAKKAVEKGLTSKPWVKTSLAPGSQVVTDYLAAAGLIHIWTSWASIWSATAAPPASATPVRSPSRSPPPWKRVIWSSPPCCRATATSKAASTRIPAPTIWRRRRSASPTLWPATSRSI
jgi:aconitate hydratase